MCEHVGTEKTKDYNMKLISKKIPYSLKRIVPMAMLAGATVFGGGCKPQNEPDDPLDKTPNTPVETPIIPKKINKELYFWQKDMKQISFDTLNKYLAMENIDTIYMVPQGTFFPPNGYGYHYFELARDYLEQRTNLAPRIRGKGSYETTLGHPTQALEDSLWFVSKGWQINALRTQHDNKIK